MQCQKREIRMKVLRLQKKIGNSQSKHANYSAYYYLVLEARYLEKIHRYRHKLTLNFASTKQKRLCHNAKIAYKWC